MSAMTPRIALIIAILPLLGGCVITPRFEMVQQINFDYPAVDFQPTGYSDPLCCLDCTA